MKHRAARFWCVSVLSGLVSSMGTPAFAGGTSIDSHARREDDTSAFVATDPTAEEQLAEEIKRLYTKYEYFVPMRDGKRLFTAVYVPKDRSKKYPFLLSRTPYSAGPYGADQYPKRLGPSPELMRSGYIFVSQDVRGCWMSEGEWVELRPHVPVKRGPADVDDSSDTYDTIEWLLGHVPDNNGKAGIWGISYPGFFASMGSIDAHPALKASSPQAPIADWFVGDDFHHNGTFFLPHAFNFYASFGHPRPYPTRKREFPFESGVPDGYDFFLTMGSLSNADTVYFRGDVAFWKEAMQHGAYDDFWKARNVRPHLKNIKPAVMTVGGWYDAEDLFGALETYRSIERQSKTSNTLVMGPWRHGGWHRGDGDTLGDIPFNAKTSRFFETSIEFPFFEQHLKGEKKAALPEAYVFETGANQWHALDAWPPKSARPMALYFGERGHLTPDPPTASNAFDDYTSDPAKPVPYIDKVSMRMIPEYMTADQRFASKRPDVLVFETAAFAADFVVAGPIEVSLDVETTGTDADFVVKIVDVYPPEFPNPEPNPTRVVMAGYQQLVRGEPMRAKFRNGFEKPVPLEPGKPTTVKFTMPDVFHAFRSGHKLMVHVQSTWFPLVDRNPQKFVDIYSAKQEDFQKATQRVYRSKEHASFLRFPVVVQGRP